LSGAAYAQDASKYPLPDPAHIPFTNLKDIKWSGDATRSNQTFNIYGAPNQPGPYAQLMKWNPGGMSKPHLHEKDRHFMVLQGTWWVSSSNVFDPNKTYPLPAGTLVKHVAGTVHWDGAKTEPVILLVTGEGPARSIRVDEKGNRVARTPDAAQD
jgi:hypothetical protein